MKGEGGEPSVETVWCNLPPNYVQVEIFTAKATFNAEGEIATIEGGPLTPEFAARFPFAVYGSLQGCSEDPDKPGAHDEWMDANVRKDFKDLLGKAKLPTDLRLHDLRHTCATLLMVQGTLRIPTKMNARSGDRERRFRASRTLIGAKRRRQRVW